MNKRTRFALTSAAAALSVGSIAAYLSSAAPRAAAQTNLAAQTAPTATMVPSSPSLLEAPGAPAVVDAANAFLATLSDTQKTTVQVGQTSLNAARWSNFPAAVVARNGIYFRDLNTAQTAAALKVARLALSPEGFDRFQGVRAADDAFAKSDEARRGPGGGGSGRGGPSGRGPGGRPGGPGGSDGPPPGNFGGPPPGGFRGPGGPGGFGGPGGQSLFGHGNYIIAFLGKPSKTAPWLLQLGGHHIAFNLYYKGTVGTATPYFVGVQPNVWKDADGKTHALLAPMHDAMHDLVNSLTPAQLTQARLASSFNDVYVGPGRDGHYPAHQGVPVSDLSAASKQLVKKAISAWTGDTVQGADYRKRYAAELSQTKVAYSGSTALSAEGDYVRIDGPHVWIEFACQASNHYHTIWRDRTTDYGAEFSF